MSNPADLLLIDGAAKELRLPGLRANFADYLEAAKRDNWSHSHLLAEVLRAELDLRDTRRSGRLLTEAKIPRAKLLSEFDLALSA
ncbi:IstB1, partial [mine drainage metagenome]